jgi:hypothetical protein
MANPEMSPDQDLQSNIYPDPMQPEDVLKKLLGESVIGLGDAHIHKSYLGTEWFDEYVADVPEGYLPPYEYDLPNDITGIDPSTGEVPADLFNTVALPRLRAAFPYYYDGQRKRCIADGKKIETTPEAAFESDALMLRILIDSAKGAVDRARKLNGVGVVSLDNDITMSWTYDTEMIGGVAAHSGAEWESMSDGEQRSAYHRWAAQDVDATVTRPAVIVGAATLKEEFGDEVLLTIFSSNTQEYLDLYATKLNSTIHSYLKRYGRDTTMTVGDAFSVEEMISYTDGRYRDALHNERELTRASKHATKEEQVVSPTLRDMLSPELSPMYYDADLFVDFDSLDAQTISAQDLKVATLLHMREERVRDVEPISIERVHLDDMPSAMTKVGPRLRYITIPEKARFFAIEVEQWERGVSV